jgi:hypothetical protein
MLQILDETGLSTNRSRSLRTVSDIAGFSTPDSISEFYSYSQTDAQRYKNAVNATGYTLNGTEESAVDALFSDLSSFGLYSKIYGFYPMLGGAEGQSINAKSVSDVRQWALDLYFFGGWSFGTNGATGNGNNTAWSANYSGYDSTTIKNSHLGVYTTVQGYASYGWDMSISDYLTNYPYAFMANYDANNGKAIFDYNYTDGIDLYSPGNYVGGTIMSYDNSDSSYIVYQNGNLFTDTAASTDSFSDPTIVVGGYDYTYNAYTDHTYGFLTFGESLTGTEIQDYLTAINTFQTTLGRNAY